MRAFITFFSVLILNASLASISGGQDTTGYVDANGLKQGHWTILNSTKHLPGYGDKDKIEEGNYKDNLKQGIWIQYYPGGAIKNKITFKDNRPDGYTVSYFENGKVCEEGIWKNNRWTGDYKLYYENGVIQHQFHYNDNGKRDGDQKYFYPNGKVMIDGAWTGGKQSGVTTEYYDDGTVKATEVFNNGSLDASKSQTFPPKSNKTSDNTTAVAAASAPKTTTTTVKSDEKPNIQDKLFTGEGYWKLYNKNKQIAKDGYFHNGHLTDGKDYIYDSNGLLMRIAVYKAGVYQGDAPITEEDRK